MLTSLALLLALRTGAPQTGGPTVPAKDAPVMPETLGKEKAGQEPAPVPRAGQLGHEVFEMIRKEDYTPASGFYGEEWELGKRPTNVAFNWGVGVLLSAYAAAAKADPAMKRPLLDLVEAGKAYWNEAPPVAGYDVLPVPKPVDRYYDDNAWMALALMEGYEATKKVDLLLQARNTYAYVMSGEAESAGGGIYWRESDKASKNTCSTAPAALAGVELYRLTADKRYLDDAVRLYKWADEHLRDPSDGLMWDNVSTDGTKVEKTKWSYNTAVMLKVENRLLDLKALPGLTRGILVGHAVAATNRWVLPSGRLSGRGAVRAHAVRGPVGGGRAGLRAGAGAADDRLFGDAEPGSGGALPLAVGDGGPSAGHEAEAHHAGVGDAGVLLRGGAGALEPPSVRSEGFSSSPHPLLRSDLPLMGKSSGSSWGVRRPPSLA